MPEYYARVEAVDFGHAVYDSDDISTIRGGSFIALDAIRELKKEFEQELDKITDNASIGLYKLKDGTAAGEMRNKILAFLKTRSGGHVDFVVDVIERNKMSFGEVRARLAAANQWSRMRRLTIPVTGVWDSSDGPCKIDGVRPGKERKSKEFHSDSVDFRRKQGKELRQTIYPNLLTGFPDLKFTKDLEELSGKNKIAFIHVDGNKFGKLRRFNGGDEAALKAYEDKVQSMFREPILERIATHMRDDAKREGKKIRLETLLWGGDEIEWVVPAANALRILRLLYEFPPPEVPFKGGAVPLTQAAGVVFCKHNAPILHIRKLARTLAGMAKKGFSDPPKSVDEGNRFHYLVLDSFDMLGGDSETHINDFYAPADYSSLMMNGCELKRFIANMRILKAAYPRGKIYEIIESLTKCGDRKPVTDIWDRGLSECGGVAASVTTAKNELVGDHIEKWFTVADLWDFVSKEDRS